MTKVNEVLNNYLNKNDLAHSNIKIKAAANIKALLSMLDLSVEVVPENSPDMLTRLITSLKGKPLTKEEAELIFEIAN